MRFNPVLRRAYLAPALGLVLITVMSACSSSSSTSNPSPSASAPSTGAATPTSTGTAATGGSPNAVAQITADWLTFFNPKTPNSKRVQLLQNGSAFASAIGSFSSSPPASGVSTKVDSVTMDSSTKATVKYDLTAVGQTVESKASGSSVLQDGTWKVGDDVFCSLLTQAKSFGISLTVPSACSSAS